MKRRELRDHIFKLVFGMEFHTADDMKEQTELYLEQLKEAKEKDLEYIGTKTRLIIEELPKIDKLINEASKGWKTTRMNKADLTILRLAVYEAVELAKKYSGDDGPSFVNGVLAKLADF